jgi:hypothetical protein
MAAEIHSFVDIEATPERVWEVLTDLPAYPEWNPFVRRAEGSFAVGGSPSLTFTPLSTALRLTVRPTVLEATAGRRLRFIIRLARLGVPGLFDAEHVLTLDRRDSGVVRLWEQARFRGLLTPLVTGLLNRNEAGAFATMNDALKLRVEGRPES